GADISPVHDPAGIEISASQERVSADRIRKAPGIRARQKEQPLPPARVCHVETVLAPLGLERRALHQSLAIVQNALCASGLDRTVGSDEDSSGPQRECKKRIRPKNQGAE